VINGSFGSKEVEDIIWKTTGGKKIGLIIADVPYARIVKDDWDQNVSDDTYIEWTKEMEKFLLP